MFGHPRTLSRSDSGLAVYAPSAKRSEEASKRTAPPSDARQSSYTMNVRPFEVLVVDDSPVYRKAIELVLRSGPYTLHYATNGAEALQLFRELSPEILITDWVMPDISGIDLCLEVRKARTGPYTYVILMTGNAEKANVIKGLGAGADDYLTKPFDSGEMLARIGVGRRLVELHRELAAKNRALEEVARTDLLTGLANRRALEDWASKILPSAARHTFSLWAVLMDIDSFKSVNDTYGHHAGDTVIKEFANLLKKNVRRSDFCGRLGGDEFLLLISHICQDEIELTINRLRQRCASFPFEFEKKSVQVTASFGVAEFKGKVVPTFSDLLQRADGMLYQAKQAGRNCVKA